MTRGNAGGAYFSNKVVHSSNPKVEPTARAVPPAAAAHLGTALGNHATGDGYHGVLKGAGVPLYSGPGYEAKGPRPCGVGPGAGRDVHSTGAQGQHGAVAGTAPAPGRGILGNRGERQP
jgi:hypothetical protein